MDQTGNIQQFKNEVALKFQLYNSLFTSLPFHKIEKTGILLSLLSSNCEEGYKKSLSPEEIIESFFSKHTSIQDEKEKLNLLFRFVQYAERQVVLFDALEDAAFTKIQDLFGSGTLKHLENLISNSKKEHQLKEHLKSFCLRIVLTAHPTQFYPGPVLAIINDLARALQENNTALVNMYLQQLGKTPFLKKQKPTPFDEAISLLWYLENVFYNAVGKIIQLLKQKFDYSLNEHAPILQLGFWPGGDRDGNPFVTADITLKVADALRGGIIKCYYLEVRKLKRRLTFEGVDNLLLELESKLYNNIFIPGNRTDISAEEILKTLIEIKNILIHQHNGLFLNLVNNLINKVEVFGLHFATLDIRQENDVHHHLISQLSKLNIGIPLNYDSLPEDEKINVLQNLSFVEINEDPLQDIYKDTLKCIKAIATIQQQNGVAGCHRYIISQCKSALNIMEVYGLFLLCGWNKENVAIDIVPLFETIEDLQNAPHVMKKLYELPFYRKHLKQRNNCQTIMVGFSDGTKDGGYMMANWSIYKAKEALTEVSSQYDLDIVFFDGRGGPPARGGGKTHKFYASMGKNISSKEIQLTIQGQTVSSNFGTQDAAQFNIEQLLHAGISNRIINEKHATLNKNEENIFEYLANHSYGAYVELKNYPDFLNYLLHVSPLRYYSDTNIGSRPTKRNNQTTLRLNDLRAIPYVGAWSQIKQNVTGYFGVGTALKKADEEGRFQEVKKLYSDSPYFKTLMDNCEMSMMKTFFPLTANLKNHPRYGNLWQKIYDEYETTKKYLFRLSANAQLMSNYPVEQMSIQLREKIVLPLLTIQQYALTRIRTEEEMLVTSPHRETLEKLLMRCSFGIINAARNSA